MQNPNKRKISKIMRTYSKLQYAFPLALWYRVFYKSLILLINGRYRQ